ncbi:MAG TPA: ATP-binding protein [Micromonosporaceae bacterium]|jgi:anti-sigma regulatory factor (Ser/Thr protein kinase)
MVRVRSVSHRTPAGIIDSVVDLDKYEACAGGLMSDDAASVVLVREPFTIERLGRIRDVVRWACTKVGLSVTRAERFVVAVCEAVTNAIQHGGGKGYLEITQTDQTALTARVVDHGPGMSTDDPVERPPASSIRGRGRWVMREYCDRVIFRSGSNGTTVELVMNLPG